MTTTVLDSAASAPRPSRDTAARVHSGHVPDRPARSRQRRLRLRAPRARGRLAPLRARLPAGRRHRARPQHVAPAPARRLRHDDHQRRRRVLRRTGRRRRRSARRRRARLFAGAPRARSRHSGRDGEQVADRRARRRAGAARPAARHRAPLRSELHRRRAVPRHLRAPPARRARLRRHRHPQRHLQLDPHGDDVGRAPSTRRSPTRSASASPNRIRRWTSAARTPRRSSRSSSGSSAALLVDPAALPLDGIGGVEPDDIAAAAAFDGAIRPIAHASWHGRAIHAFVGPAFVGGTHPLARVSGVTNGIVIAGRSRGRLQCFIGPGAGPDVTAATLLDDVAELMAERRVRTPAPEPSQTGGVGRRARTRPGSCASSGAGARVGRRRSPRLLRHLEHAAGAARRSRPTP